MAVYNVAVRTSKQEDGLFRAECPDLQGCFVDAETLEAAMADIQDAIHLWIESQKAMKWPLPNNFDGYAMAVPMDTTLPVEAA